jgi:hypothetical protein
MYAAPASDGTPVLKPGDGAFVLKEEFVIALTNSKVSDVFEIPILVAHIPQSCWVRA